MVSENRSDNQSELKEDASKLDETQYTWDTDDIAEERSYNSKKTKRMFYAIISVNCILSLLQLSFYITCEFLSEDCKFGKFGFADVRQAHFTISCVLLTLYVSVILAYIAILVKMRKLFKAAFPNNYQVIRFRFLVIFVIYEAFLGFRSGSYYFILFS